MTVDTQITHKVLAFLNEWGWDRGLNQLKMEIRPSSRSGENLILESLCAWLSGDRDAFLDAEAQLKDVPQVVAWAHAGWAHRALLQDNYEHSIHLLDEATTLAVGDEPILTGTIKHCRGTISYHQGKDELALSSLYEALALFGREHFASGRVLDTLGMIYANKNNFFAAREFFEQSLKCKTHFGDTSGIAISHGQLGRLYLDWGHVSRAEEHFRKDLELSRAICDERGEAQMFNCLGQIAIIQERWADAAGWLDESIRLSEFAGWKKLEGFSRKDRSIVYLQIAQLSEAIEQLDQAQKLFSDSNFAEGLAHILRTRGMILCAEKRYEEAERALRDALVHFDTHSEPSEATKTQLEKARVLRRRGASHPVVIDAFINALERAESCRRAALALQIENELREVDEISYYRHIYRRARGRDVSAQTVSLLSGDREAATVLFLDIEGSTEYSRNSDPEIVMLTLNQMMAELEDVLRPHHVLVTAYLGDGFMALSRGPDHAKRGVRAALQMIPALFRFNLPRKVLGLQPLKVRIGISSGEVYIGNVGTYNKMDFTAIGTTTHLAARLQSEAEPGLPCISATTYELVQHSFLFKSDTPRMLSLKGLGQQPAWDVTGPLL